MSARPSDESLTALQEFVAAHARAAEPLEHVDGLGERARSRIVESAELSALDRLEIYREQFWLRHVGSLEEDFPGLALFLGEIPWNRLVRRYLGDEPPRARALRDLGAALPAFVERTLAGELDEAAHAIAVELARLEWAYLECFDAEDSPPLDVDRLREFSEDDWERSRIELAPALRLLAFEFPVADFRRALRVDPNAEPPARATTFLVAYRGQDRALWDKTISEPAFRLLEAFSRGLPLVPACEAVLARLPGSEPIFDEHLMSWFTTWGRLGWIHDVRVPVEPALPRE